MISRVPPASQALTAEDCRVRFAQLDRAEDSATGEESGADQGEDTRDSSSVVYGVAAPGVLENAGLSFAELEHKAKNMKSRYVCSNAPFVLRNSPSFTI